jgi:hypothetical protein
MLSNLSDAFDTHDKIVAFGWVLHRCHIITDISTLLSYMEKPWKWEREYRAHQELGGKTDEATINAMAKRFA